MRIRQPIIAAAAKRQPGRFIDLFFAQLLLLIRFPYLETPSLPAALFRLLGVSALLSCVYAVSEKRAQCITALALALPAGILNTIYVLNPSARAAVPTLICTLQAQTTDVVFVRSGNQRTLIRTQTEFFWRSAWIQMFLS